MIWPVPHDPDWAAEFDREADALRGALGDTMLRIEHIGSTSISGIHAKPIIDILIEAYGLDRVDDAAGVFRSLGYEAMGEYGIAGRRYFRKSSGARRTHHVHVFASGHPAIARHLVFRDYLRAHPEIARAYSGLKRNLADQGLSGEAYQDAKADWIARSIDDAERWLVSKNP